jgi:hypothetical protein
MEKFFNKKLFFVLILLCGFLLRLYFIFSRDIFTDEVFYTNVAINTSYGGILNVTHWIKDHGIFYLLSLKFLTFFSQNIFYLRLFDLIPYLLVSLFLYRFFIFFGFGYLALLPVFLHSFLSYFVFMQSIVSPFNLVLLFSTIALLSLVTFIFSNKNSNSNLIIFVLSSAITFYSDYSSFYFFLSLIPILFWVAINKKNKLLKLIAGLIIIAFSILPGLFFIFNNFHSFSSLNDNSYLSLLNFWQYSKIIGDILLLRIGGSISLIILLIILTANLYIILNSKKPFLKFMALFSLSTTIISTVFVYLFSKQVFLIFVERSFWFFYLIQTFSIAGIIFYFKNKKSYLPLLLILIFFLTIFRFIDFKGQDFPGRVPDLNINYKNLANNIKKEYRNSKNVNIIYFDDNFVSVPLSKYYLKDYLNIKITKSQPVNIDKIKPSVLIEFDQFERNTIEIFGKYPHVIYKIDCDIKNCQFLKEK